jgi:hypothetical protein
MAQETTRAKKAANEQAGELSSKQGLMAAIEPISAETITKALHAQMGADHEGS